jgi:hypothetical protein
MSRTVLEDVPSAPFISPVRWLTNFFIRRFDFFLQVIIFFVLSFSFNMIFQPRNLSS